MNKGYTVKELTALCVELCNKGYGDKHILISDDDEGNGFHTLFYSFTYDIDSIKEYKDGGFFHDDNDPNEVVILG